METIIDIEEIKTLIPHRYPFLLVDRVVELRDKYIKGYKNVTANEPFFQGHFPEYPIMPGVLQVEAMAQLAAIYKFKVSPEIKHHIIYFMSIEKAKFRKPVVPGDVLTMEVEIKKETLSRISFHGRAFVNDKLCSEAQMMALAAPKEKK